MFGHAVDGRMWMANYEKSYLAEGEINPWGLGDHASDDLVDISPRQSDCLWANARRGVELRRGSVSGS